MTPSDRAAIERVRTCVSGAEDWFRITPAFTAGDLRILLALAERAVPRGPTEAMKKAGDDDWNAHDQNDYVETCAAIWRAMHDAATDQPAQCPHPSYSGAPCRDGDETDVRCDLCGAARPTKPADGVAAQVFAEVERAIKKFPTWPTDPLHALAVLGEEFGELTKAVLQMTYEPHKVEAHEVRDEAIQTAAMALRFLNSLSEYTYTPGPQHAQRALAAQSDQPAGGEG